MGSPSDWERHRIVSKGASILFLLRWLSDEKMTDCSCCKSKKGTAYYIGGPVDSAVDSGERNERGKEHHKGYSQFLVAGVDPQDKGGACCERDGGVPTGKTPVKQRFVGGEDSARKVPGPESA